MTVDRRITDTAPRPARAARARGLLAAARSTSDKEAVFLAGLIGLGLGFGLVWLPLGLIIPSIVLVAIGILAPPDRGNAP